MPVSAVISPTLVYQLHSHCRSLGREVFLVA